MLGAVPAATTIELHLQLGKLSDLQVDYWSDSTDRLRVTVNRDSVQAGVTLYRLRASRTYHFEVRTVDEQGNLGPATIGLFDTSALPDDLAGMRFVTIGTPSYGVTVFQVYTDGFNGFVGVNGQGEVVWFYRTQTAPQGFTRRQNGNFVLVDWPNGLVEVTPAGKELRRKSSAALGGAAHHDVIATPQNTLIFLQQETREFDGGPLVGDRIVEWNPETGTVTPRWSVHDFYSPDTSWGIHSGREDWTHANSLSIGPHGNIILSLNWLDQVISIAPNWAKVEWRLGGYGSDFAVDPAAEFMGQHTAQMTSESRVLLFDNGRDKSNGDLRSRGLEISLDSVKHLAKLVWQFYPTPAINAPYVGSARRLPNGNTIVQFGLSAGMFDLATGPVAAYEVTPSGRTVAAIMLPDVFLSYRGEPLLSVGGERVVPKP